MVRLIDAAAALSTSREDFRQPRATYRPVNLYARLLLFTGAGETFCTLEGVESVLILSLATRDAALFLLRARRGGVSELRKLI